MSRYRRASLGSDFGYTPGEQPPEGGDWLKLNTNEAPLPASPAVAAAVSAAAAGLRRYPNPYGEPLRTALASRHGVDPEQVFVGNGADQVIDCCFRAFCEPGSRVVYPVPTYSLFCVLAALFAVATTELPLDAGLGFPPELGTAPGELRFAVNPNSPTGTWMRPDALEELLASASGVVAIDEAYCDFAPASCVPLLAAHDNWLVLRTLSKSHALAGLRVGYAVGDAALIGDLNAVKDSYPIDRCAIAGAIAALDDEAHHRAIVDCVVSERQRVTAALTDAGWHVPPSAANFVFARPPDGDALGVLHRLRQAGILVRHFASPYADRLRITIGAPAENDRFLASLGV
jgi:histidinol-phosphate aminotransferase